MGYIVIQKLIMEKASIKYQNFHNKSLFKTNQSSIEHDGAPTGIKNPHNNLEQLSKIEKSKANEKEKLIDQNVRLKTQIFDLSRQLDEIMEREQKSRKKYGESNEDDDEQTKNKKMELRKQQLQVISLKNKIHMVKRQLQTVYNNRTLTAKEDQLRYLRNQLQSLEQEKKSLLKIKKEQSKALKILKNEEEYEEKIDELKKQLAEVKEEAKTLNQKLMDSERILRKNHEQYIVKQTKIKELEQKLLASHQKAKKKKPLEEVTPQMISDLEEQIQELEKQRKETEKNWHDKLNAIDTELQGKKMEEEKKLMLLKQKQKELRLNELKIKELRKLIKHNMIDGSQGHNNLSQDVDMSQFRHKRNIKYMNQ